MRKVENFTLIVNRPSLLIQLTVPPGRTFSNEVKSGQDNSLPLQVTNIGNKSLANIKLSSDTPGWVVSFSPSVIDSLAPGNIRTIDLTVRPPSGATTQNAQVNVVAESDETRQTQTIFLMVKPARMWVLVWVGIGVVVVALFVLIYMRMSKQG